MEHDIVYEEKIRKIKANLNSIINSLPKLQQLDDSQYVIIKQKLESKYEEYKSLYKKLDQLPPKCSECNSYMIRVSDAYVTEEWGHRDVVFYQRWDCPNKKRHLTGYLKVDTPERIEVYNQINGVRKEIDELEKEAGKLKKEIIDKNWEIWEDWYNSLTEEQKIALQIILIKPCTCSECQGLYYYDGLIEEHIPYGGISKYQRNEVIKLLSKLKA